MSTKPAPYPIDEESRLRTLYSMNILDTPIEDAFQRLTRITKSLFNVPISAISLIDKKRQWFKSIQGMDICSTDRKDAICSYTILNDSLFEVPDTLKDPRFAQHPLVINPPYIRYYAGYPVKAANGKRIGTVCILDTKPRKLEPEQVESLADMAGLVEAELQKRQFSSAHKRLIKDLE